MDYENKDDITYDDVNKAYKNTLKATQTLGRSINEALPKNNTTGRTVGDNIRVNITSTYNNSTGRSKYDSSTSKTFSNTLTRASIGITAGSEVFNVGNLFYNGGKLLTGSDYDGKELSQYVREKVGTTAGSSAAKIYKDGKKLADYKNIAKIKATDGRKTWKSATRDFKEAQKLGEVKNFTKNAKKIASGISIVQTAFAVVDWIWHDIAHIESPVDTHLRKPFSGNWDKMDECVNLWDNTADMYMDLNIQNDDLLDQLELMNDLWCGRSADAFFEKRTMFTGPLGTMSLTSQQLSEGTAAAAELSQELFDTIVMNIMSIISDLATIVADIGTPVIGWVKGLVADAAILIFDITQTILDMNKAYNDYQTAVLSFQKVVDSCHMNVEKVASI